MLFTASKALLATAAMLSLPGTAIAAPQGAGNAGTACCPGGNGCTTFRGTSDNGHGWCYGFWSGTLTWSQKDADVAKCLTDLHANQDTRCISKAGSPCDLNDSMIMNTREGRLDGNNQLPPESAEAIRGAIQAMATDAQGWDSDNFITFAHVAANGAAQRSIEVRLKGSGTEC